MRNWELDVEGRRKKEEGRRKKEEGRNSYPCTDDLFVLLWGIGNCQLVIGNY
ncbi:hypothetical protein [Microcoleus vaginatus]|uniref:hypothetical protein n=1 Tax=Microcoleus vaginatus TaxID=119532 RepID=UPI0013053F92